MKNSASMGEGNDNDDATKLPPPATMDNNISSNVMGNSSGDYSDNVRTAQLIQALRLGQHNPSVGGGGEQQQQEISGQQNLNAYEAATSNNNPLPGTITNVGSFASSSSTAAIHPSALPGESAATVENTATAGASVPSRNASDHEESHSEDDEEEDQEEEGEDMEVVASSSFDNRTTTTAVAHASGTVESSQNPHETEDFKRPARAVFQKYNQCKRTLGVLMLGSNDDDLSPDVFQKFPFKDIPNSYRLYVPQQGDYVAEINRRSHFLAKEAQSANDRRAIFKGISRGRHPRPKNWTVPKCREWLADPAHYIGTPDDKQFLLETIAELKRQAQMQILLGNNNNDTRGNSRTEEAPAVEDDSGCGDEKPCAGQHDTSTMTCASSSHSTALPEVLESSTSNYEPMSVAGGATAPSKGVGEKRKASIALEERDKNISHHQPPPQQPQQRVMNKAAMQKDLSSVREIVASHDDELQRQQHETAALRQELQDQKAQTAALQQQVSRMEQILDFHRLSGSGEGAGAGSGSGA